MSYNTMLGEIFEKPSRSFKLIKLCLRRRCFGILFSKFFGHRRPFKTLHAVELIQFTCAHRIGRKKHFTLRHIVVVPTERYLPTLGLHDMVRAKHPKCESTDRMQAPKSASNGKDIWEDSVCLNARPPLASIHENHVRLLKCHGKNR